VAGGPGPLPIFALSRVNRLYLRSGKTRPITTTTARSEGPARPALRHKEHFKPCLDFVLRRWACSRRRACRSASGICALAAGSTPGPSAAVDLCALAAQLGAALRRGRAPGALPRGDPLQHRRPGLSLLQLRLALAWMGLLLSLRWAGSGALGRPWGSARCGCSWADLHFFFWPVLAWMSCCSRARCAALHPGHQPPRWSSPACCWRAAAYWLSVQSQPSGLGPALAASAQATAALRWAWGPAAGLLPRLGLALTAGGFIWPGLAGLLASAARHALGLRSRPAWPSSP